MFDDQIDDYYRNRGKISISERNILGQKKECYFVTAVLMGVETIKNFQKMETLVVDLMWTEKIQMQKVYKMQIDSREMFMITGMMLISKIGFIHPMNTSTSF